MKLPALLFPLLCASAASLFAEPPALPKPPIVNDTALRVELVASFPEVEACTTVCGAPDGSVYVGNDARDGRLNSSQPVNTIVRFSGLGPERKRTVFADKIYSPAGSAWHDGWLYVMHDPLLTRFKDTDGDGVADVREDLITDLGLPPYEGLNDHVVSGFTLGMDGFFYISVGDRGIYRAKSAKDGSTITLQGGGIIRCRADGTQLEIFSSGTRNHLQVNLDAEDNAFTRDNTDDGNGWWTRVTHHIEGGYYGYPYLFRSAPNYGVVRPSEQTLNAIKQHGGTVDRAAIMADGRKVADVVSAEAAGNAQKTEAFLPAMADFGGGSPTGGLCYLSDGLPEQYRGRHFFSEWGKGGIFVTEVARDGATFKLVSDTKLVEPEKGGDFRPMQLSVATDGSLLIADWGYGGWKSPRIAGAIWRVSWPEAKIAPRLKDESKASVQELISALAHPDRDQRLRAQGALALRGDAVLAAIIEQMHNTKGPVLARVHALWAMNALGDSKTATDAAGKSEGLIRQLLADPNPVLRAQAVRALGLRRANDASADLIKLLHDESPFVRRSVLEALGRMSGGGKETTGPMLLALGDSDAWVRAAAGAAVRARLWDTRARFSGGGIAEHMIDDVKKGLHSPDTEIRSRVWDAVGAALKPRTVGRLRITSGLGDERVRAEYLGDTGVSLLEAVIPETKAADAQNRLRAVLTLGALAYLETPYDGHWWGTQPVKSPPPPSNVAWSGTPQALAALASALADPDIAVRMSAAKAFTTFTLGGMRSVASPASAGGGGGSPAIPDLQTAEKAATAALRARLTGETEPAIRRQLLESLGVQKDPKAMDVFRQIALDEKADPDFRETAIAAVANIGGDAAKQTIAQLAAATLSPAATRKIITAAGDLKVLEAAPLLIAHLKDADAGNREFSARSLQQLGPKSNAGPALIEALADKDGKVVAAAVDALGSFRDKAALPAIIALLEKKKALRETTGALANMPDESAIPVLVETLRDKNTTFRRSAIKALKSMREKAWPQVEALLASGRVPEELVPEIRNAFDSGAITKWKMAGVFENVWDAVHPPEKDALEAGAAVHDRGTPPGGGGALATPAPFLTKKYHNAEGKDVGWIDVTADADAGRVDLEKVFKTNAMVCAYAFTEIDAPEAADGKLFTSADDEIAVWLNGQKILDLPGSHGYEADKNETPVHFHAGKNQLFLKIGNKAASWVFHARIPGFDNGKFIKSKEPLPDEKQRLFALATKPDGSYANAGNPKNGEKLFFDQTGPLGAICATCHAINGKGGQVGPDLSAIAANYKRPDLITSIHEPSKTIALGFEQFLVETKGGETVAGALRQETAETLTITGVDAVAHVIKKADVKTRTAIPISLMPQGLTLSLKAQDFVDLIAYLETLKGK